MKLRIWVFALVSLLSFAGNHSSAFASLIITVEDFDVPLGGIGTVDVTIASDSSDELAQFVISMALNSNRIRFVDPPQNLQLGDPDYILSGNSSAESLGGLETISSGIYDNTDVALIGGVTVPSSPGKLLVRVAVETNPDMLPEIGDTFSISLSPGIFEGPEGNALEIIPEGGLNGSRLTATATIVASTAAVPEPASMAIWAVFGVTIALLGARRYRATRTTCT